MNTVTITPDTVCVEITGWDRIWSFKSRITIPKERILRAYQYDGTLKPPLWRCPGTAFPKLIIAGTYYGRNRKEFWNTHFKRTVVLDLQDADYTRIVVDVEDPEKTISDLQNDKI